MFRKMAIGLGLLLVIALALLLGLKAWADAHFFDGYDPSAPLRAEEGDLTTVDGVDKAFGIEVPARYRVQPVYFDGRPGDPAPTLITFPLDFEGPLPVVVLVHGSHQEKEFVEEICTPFNEAGFAVVCFDQHMRGERKVRKGRLGNILAFRERTWKTVHDTRRLIDYLQTRPDVDPQRIYLIGASYGAITGTTVVAREPRIRAAVLVVGGGDVALMADAPVVRRMLPRWAHPLAKTFAKALLGAADPVRTAPATAGTPVLMQNGSNDRIVIPEAGQALYDALGEPKEIRWYPIDHPDREDNGAEVIKMLGDTLAWVLEQDGPFRGDKPRDPGA